MFLSYSAMGKVKKTKKFGAVKRMIHATDPRINKGQVTEKEQKKEDEVRHVEKPSSALFFKYNTQLGPPYHVLIDTNFLNFSIRNKLDICSSMLDCLYAKCTPYITDCVMGELEKLGAKVKYTQFLRNRFVRNLSVCFQQNYKPTNLAWNSKEIIVVKKPESKEHFEILGLKYYALIHS